MEEQVINYLKENTTSDGIDVAHGLKMSIAETYRTLQNLEAKGKIRRENYGIQARYTVLI